MPELPMEPSMHQWSWHPMDSLWEVCKSCSLEENMLQCHTSYTSSHTDKHKWIGAHTHRKHTFIHMADCTSIVAETWDESLETSCWNSWVVLKPEHFAVVSFMVTKQEEVKVAVIIADFQYSQALRWIQIIKCDRDWNCKHWERMTSLVRYESCGTVL